MQINETARRTYETAMADLRNFMANPWQTEMAPYQVIPHVYYVGNKYVGSYLLDTSEGLVLIDAALQETVYLLFESIRKVGFDPKDIKKVLISHGHVDHTGGLRIVQEYSGCEIWFPKGDAFFLTERRDLILEEEHAPEFEVTGYYNYDDMMDFGNIQIQPVHTPGHTPGCTSFFITVHNNRTTLLGMHGGLGLNGLSKAELLQNGLPASLQEDYLNSLKKLVNVPVDIVIPSHLSHFPGDYLGMIANNTDGSGDALRVPDAWKLLIEDRIAQAEALFKQDELIDEN
ncbi:MAG: MBL fold metallo-hydrolase [Lachnospiraceae bacterium]|nr:MBL fold metallo-hydrolase [Lachnospiraceae bacterium]